MDLDYHYYLIGCRHREVVPLSQWRFTIAYAFYQKMLRWSLTEWRQLDPKRRTHTVIRWNRARSLVALVNYGRDLALSLGHFDDENGATGAGDREPRIPLSPQLTACGARPLPTPDLIPRCESWS